ncbi:MAG: zinc ribbon domain-containing protein [Oscillospiraceae bacterium]|nr:zinc ribbon domain-containing protein [Oscillospiraceae bacterium]
MSAFDNFLSKARDVADAAAQKTGEVVEISKLKLQAIKLNSNIQKAYEELGSVYYNSVKFGGNAEDQLNGCVAEIDRLLKEQEELENSMNDVGKSTGHFCTACGFENSAKAAFCSNCGTPLNSTFVDVQMSSNEE